MYYFYVLQFEKNKKLYRGVIQDLKRRVKEHRSGNSNFTAKNDPFTLVFYEAYLDKRDAVEAERYF